VALYRRYDPIATPFLIQAQAFTDSAAGGRLYASRAQGGPGRGAGLHVPWNWRTPAYDGHSARCTASTSPATFISYRDGFFAGSTAGKRMADRLASTWAAFAKTAIEQRHIPPWKPYSDAQRNDHAVRQRQPPGGGSARRDPGLVGANPRRPGRAAREGQVMSTSYPGSAAAT